jgi:VWFA-related protein
MPQVRPLPVVAAAAAAVFAITAHPDAAGPAAALQTGGSPPRIVYVSAVDKEGRVVDDLTAEDFVVKEGGKTTEITRAIQDETPMQIAILVDDSGTGIFRSGIVRFIQTLQGRAEFSIIAITGQPLKLVDYTANGEALLDAVNKISARPGTPDGGQLLQGIYDTAKELEKREAARPVIVAMTIPGEEHSTLPAKYVLEQLRDSRASLHVFLAGGSSSRQMVAPSRPAALLEENLALSEVLGDGPDQSGGRREEIVASAGIVAGLQELANRLLHQYAISYELPPGAKSSDRLSVSVRRSGVTLRAPKRIPKR